jgi:hypothetical protein
MSIRTRLVSLTSTVALVATLTAVVGAQAAEAATPIASANATAGRPVHSATVATSAGSATLYVYDFDDGNYWITVVGWAELGSVVSRNLSIRLYADDWFDYNLFDYNGQTTNADGSFNIEFPLCCSRLDEDWGWDEVYAKVYVWDPSRGVSVLFITNNVEGYF